MTQKYWLVWNEKKGLCNFPTRTHHNIFEANDEAERLAQKHPGESFAVLEVVGIVKLANIQWEDLNLMPLKEKP